MVITAPSIAAILARELADQPLPEDRHALPQRHPRETHALRRMTASLLVAEGVDLATAAAIMGHKSASVLLDVYVWAPCGPVRRPSPPLSLTAGGAGTSGGRVEVGRGEGECVGGGHRLAGGARAGSGLRREGRPGRFEVAGVQGATSRRRGPRPTA